MLETWALLNWSLFICEPKSSSSLWDRFGYLSFINNSHLMLLHGLGLRLRNRVRRMRGYGVIRKNLGKAIITDPIKLWWSSLEASCSKETLLNRELKSFWPFSFLSRILVVFVLVSYKANILSYINYPKRCSRVRNNKIKPNERDSIGFTASR